MMRSEARADWLIPAGLLLLCLVPALGGASRIIELGTGSAITAANARFFASPLPVVLHVFGSLAYCVVGAFQFSSGLRRSRPTWHRRSGRWLVPIGLVASLSGLWMTQFYPRATENFDGPALYAIRLVVGFGMTWALLLGVLAARRLDFARHRNWMVRAYALGLGAGTQVLTHIPWFLLPDWRGEALRTVCMGAGWAINAGVAEWIIARHERRTANIAQGELH
jgi:uncharacterized membrane protein